MKNLYRLLALICALLFAFAITLSLLPATALAITAYCALCVLGLIAVAAAVAIADVTDMTRARSRASPWQDSPRNYTATAARRSEKNDTIQRTFSHLAATLRERLCSTKSVRIASPTTTTPHPLFTSGLFYRARDQSHQSSTITNFHLSSTEFNLPSTTAGLA